MRALQPNNLMSWAFQLKAQSITEPYNELCSSLSLTKIKRPI